MLLCKHTSWIIVLPGKPLLVKTDQAAAGGLPSSWLCSATLRFHFCPKPERNKRENNVKKYFLSSADNKVLLS